MSIKNQLIKPLLEPIGIEINGKNSWDPQVKDERLYKRLRKGQSLALGESYMEGWWECEALEEFFLSHHFICAQAWEGLIRQTERIW